MSTKTKRAPDAAKTERARKAALAEIKGRLDGKAPKTPKTPKAPKEKKPKRASGLDHAAAVLANANVPLNAKTIAERAVAAGWKTSGKTPEATLYAAIVREIAAKGEKARFKKQDRGLFVAA